MTFSAALTPELGLVPPGLSEPTRAHLMRAWDREMLELWQGFPVGRASLEDDGPVPGVLPRLLVVQI